MSQRDKKNSKFLLRQLRFLELYFTGFSMQDAARASGYRGSSASALCNTGRAILTKFSKTPKALFYRAGARERKIAQLLVGITKESKPERQLIALKILSKCLINKSG